MLDKKKLKFFLENGYNVLIEGKHGVGKTTVILDVFKESGLVLGESCLYFSGSTMDPFIDFCGVPLKVDQDGETKIKLVLPEHIHPDKVEAIFMDEYNRTASKIRNAVMELIQFKSINGRKFPKLRVIWAAINPESKDDDEEVYNVERTDPAQKDRFHIHLSVPYKCDRAYFNSKYGIEMTRPALEWWQKLPQNIQDMVSPRRLDYALQLHKDGGDLADVIPEQSNPYALKASFILGPDAQKIQGYIDNNDERSARKYVSKLDGFNNVVNYVKNNKQSKSAIMFFATLFTDEQISLILSDDNYSEFLKFIKEDIETNKHASYFTIRILQFVKASPSQEAKEIKKFLEDTLGDLEYVISVNLDVPEGKTGSLPGFDTNTYYCFNNTSSRKSSYKYMKAQLRSEIEDKQIEYVVKGICKCVNSSHIPTIKKHYGDAAKYIMFLLSKCQNKDKKYLKKVFAPFINMDHSKKVASGFTSENKAVFDNYVC